MRDLPRVVALAMFCEAEPPRGVAASTRAMLLRIGKDRRWADVSVCGATLRFREARRDTNVEIVTLAAGPWRLLLSIGKRRRVVEIGERDTDE